VNFRDVFNSVCTRAVRSSRFGQKVFFWDGLWNIREVENFILFISIPDNVPNDSIDTSCSIWNINDCLDWSTEDLCYSCSRLVKKFRILITDEWVRLRFAGFSILLLFVPDKTRKTAK
jgi:hypothetical protein